MIATILWAGEVPGHGFGIRVPLAFAELVGPRSWIKIEGDHDTMVQRQGDMLILDKPRRAAAGQIVQWL